MPMDGLASSWSILMCRRVSYPLGTDAKGYRLVTFCHGRLFPYVVLEDYRLATGYALAPAH